MAHLTIRTWESFGAERAIFETLAARYPSSRPFELPRSPAVAELPDEDLPTTSPWLAQVLERAVSGVHAHALQELTLVPFDFVLPEAIVTGSDREDFHLRKVADLSASLLRSTGVARLRLNLGRALREKLLGGHEILTGGWVVGDSHWIATPNELFRAHVEARPKEMKSKRDLELAAKRWSDQRGDEEDREAFEVVNFRQKAIPLLMRGQELGLPVHLTLNKPS